MTPRRYYAASLLAGCLLCCVCSQAAAAPPATNVMALETASPDMSTAIKAVRNNDAELAAYLSDPDTVCTFFVPTNKAMSDWMRWFGKYAGRAVQNVTFLHSALNYHVVPGVALTADQVAKGGKQLTRANETVFFWNKGAEPRVYSRPDYPITLNRTNVKAGKCIIHSIDQAMVPPTSAAMVDAWLMELGNMPPAPPKSQWAPKQAPLPEGKEAAAAAAAAAIKDSPVAATPAANSKPVSSSAQASRGLTGACWLPAAGVILGAVAAAWL